MNPPYFFIALDSKTICFKKNGNKKQFGFKQIEQKQCGNDVQYVCYKKNEEEIHTYYFIEKQILFVNVTPYIALYLEMLGNPAQVYEMDVKVDAFSHEDAVQAFRVALQNRVEVFNQTQHLYSQQMWHDDAVMIANRESLQPLRDAVDLALSQGEARYHSFTSDGEGYTTYITCLDDTEKWSKLELPYIQVRRKRSHYNASIFIVSCTMQNLRRI
ncbi:hypothetical protein H9I32_13320 [Bacillus sp. Xin]|uniref:hypothetical protein n=1 Tax=unclassified Bacillus (in: firmicutes) TaxID=185979 RepID=UPI0015723235|nr:MULTISPECIES: hypothetical protein [unclassified Bacillus (in: firmicutes)]MBC6973319.1 hypothetical protein [Bacillus sp. Xin]NSW35678.1 hypothetical protein [Bacillus sp. Xin1]